MASNVALEKKNMKHPCTWSVDDLADDSGVFPLLWWEIWLSKGAHPWFLVWYPQQKSLLCRQVTERMLLHPGNYFNVDTKSGCSGIRLVHNRNRVDQEVEQHVAVIYGIWWFTANKNWWNVLNLWHFSGQYGQPSVYSIPFMAKHESIERLL